jgi:protein CpxP
MQRISYQTAGLAIALAFVLVGSVQAQQQQHQQHHPGGAQASPSQPAGAGQGVPAQPQIPDQMQGMMEHMQGMMEHMQGMMEHMQGMRRRQGMIGRRGMMGRQAMREQEKDDDEDAAPQRRMRDHRGMRDIGDIMHHGGMIQHHIERLARHLELTEEQRTQMWTVLGSQAKEAIRLKADVETLALDLRQLLEADPVDLARVKPLLQSMAGKEADLRLLHITAMQDMSKILTPEQRQKLRIIRHSMMDHGGMMGHHGMMGMGGRMGPSGMRGHKPATQ